MPVPNTNIKLLHEVPLDASYQHTIYWASEAAQTAYFSGKVKTGLAFTQCMYHRIDDELRVDASIDQCLDVNYVMYQNTNYGNKWFYAFVTGCRFINSNCTGLKIQTDVMQTWYFDYDLKPGFIERNHPATDAIGDNLVEEGLELGDHVIMDIGALSFDEYDIVMLSTFDPSTYQPAAGNYIYGGIYSGLVRTVIGSVQRTGTGTQSANWVYITSPTTVLNDIVTNHPDLVDGIVSIHMSPRGFGTSCTRTWLNVLTKPTTSTPLKQLPAATGYVPRNRKLYTAPYTQIYLTNGDGSGRYYAFEDFGVQVSFRLYTDQSPSESVLCVPVGYRGLSHGTTDRNSLDFVDSMSMGSFPECSWTSDVFKTYLAQNKSSIGLSIATDAGKVIGGAILAVGSGGVGAAAGVGSMVSGAVGLAGTAAGLMDKSRQPPAVHGAVTGTTFYSCGEKGFRAYALTLKREFLEIIDNYFDLRGYAIKKVGTPNINGRPHWSYVKMQNAFCTPHSGSGCTASDLVAIQNVYNAGITFWKSASEVGDYSLNNTAT